MNKIYWRQILYNEARANIMPMITLEELHRIVEEYFDDKIFRPGRKHIDVYRRQIYYYLCRVYRHQYEDIGRYCKKHHSTVIHGVQLVDYLYRKGAVEKKDIEGLIDRIGITPEPAIDWHKQIMNYVKKNSYRFKGVRVSNDISGADVSIPDSNSKVASESRDKVPINSLSC